MRRTLVLSAQDLEHALPRRPAGPAADIARQREVRAIIARLLIHNRHLSSSPTHHHKMSTELAPWDAANASTKKHSRFLDRIPLKSGTLSRLLKRSPKKKAGCAYEKRLSLEIKVLLFLRALGSSRLSSTNGHSTLARRGNSIHSR